MPPTVDQKWRPMELRKHLRIEVVPPFPLAFSRIEVPVSFTGDTEGEGTVVNLSVKGCRVLSDATVELGDHLSLSFDIRQKDPLMIDLATVRWAQGRAFGLEFISVGLAEEKRLRQFITVVAGSQK